MAEKFKVLLNKLIIIAGQWKTATDDKEKLEKQFSSLLDQIESISKMSREQIIQTLIQHIEGGVKA
jgi:hypothetical protein